MTFAKLIAAVQPKGDHESTTMVVTGRVRRVAGLVVEAEGMNLSVGSNCQIGSRSNANRKIPAEVIGFKDGRCMLIPCGPTEGIAEGDPVIFSGEPQLVQVSSSMLGRVLDGNGQPIDNKGPLAVTDRVGLDAPPISPLQRKRITTPLSTGVRAIDTLLTVGKGQRMGIFAGSGVGKSVLLGMLARNSEAAVNVIALIGERGREVREFIERDLGAEGLQRSIVIVSTSDEPPVQRLRAARVATSIAEWFRDQGENVLFMMDSVTRVALAQREVGLSASEPPTTKAFPPSVFSLLAKLLERTGPGKEGTITAFYTVLVEADDINDPIGDAVRGILDGHIWLSRDLANKGHFPAVDILQSVSRVMKDVVEGSHQERARALIADLANYKSAEDLIQLGAYVRGVDKKTDLAIDRMPAIETLLKQLPTEEANIEESYQQLLSIYSAQAESSGEKQ